MAVSASRVSGASHVVANKRYRVYDLTFSGNYADDGESVSNSTVGLKKIEQVIAPGVVPKASDFALGNPLGVVINSTGSAVKFLFYDSAADGDALDEKPAESHVAVGPIRVTFIGY